MAEASLYASPAVLPQSPIPLHGQSTAMSQAPKN